MNERPTETSPTQLKRRRRFLQKHSTVFLAFLLLQLCTQLRRNNSNNEGRLEIATRCGFFLLPLLWHSRAFYTKMRIETDNTQDEEKKKNTHTSTNARFNTVRCRSLRTNDRPKEKRKKKEKIRYATILNSSAVGEAGGMY